MYVQMTEKTTCTDVSKIMPLHSLDEYPKNRIKSL